MKLITSQERNSGTSHSHFVLSTNKCWRASFWIQLLPLITRISMNKWKLVCIFSLIISLIYTSVMRPVFYPLARIKWYPAECRTVQTCWLWSSCSPPLVLMLISITAHDTLQGILCVTLQHTTFNENPKQTPWFRKPVSALNTKAIIKHMGCPGKDSIPSRVGFHFGTMLTTWGRAVHFFSYPKQKQLHLLPSSSILSHFFRKISMYYPYNSDLWDRMKFLHH